MVVPFDRGWGPAFGRTGAPASIKWFKKIGIRQNFFGRKNEVWLKWKIRSWRLKRILNHQNRSYPRVLLTMSKFARNSGDYRIDRNYRTYRTRDLSIESIEGRPAFAAPVRFTPLQRRKTKSKAIKNRSKFVKKRKKRKKAPKSTQER